MMPHKVETAGLPGVIRPAAAIAGSCNAVRRLSDGRLEDAMFDSEGFVRGMLRKGLKLQAAVALVVRCGGVGSGIAASLTAVEVARQHFGGWTGSAPARALSGARCRHRVKRSGRFRPGCQRHTDRHDSGDPMPMDVLRIDVRKLDGEVVMKSGMRAFFVAARARCSAVQIGSDMLFGQIPARLEFQD